MAPALVVYLAGIVIGLLGSDAPPLTRLTLALLWPVGVAAFVVTVSILLAAALIAFPMIGAAAALLAAGLAALLWLI